MDTLKFRLQQTFNLMRSRGVASSASGAGTPVSATAAASAAASAAVASSTMHPPAVTAVPVPTAMGVPPPMAGSAMAPPPRAAIPAPTALPPAPLPSIVNFNSIAPDLAQRPVAVRTFALASMLAVGPAFLASFHFPVVFGLLATPGSPCWCAWLLLSRSCHHDRRPRGPRLEALLTCRSSTLCLALPSQSRC